jgi:hypothetical protein
MNNVQRQYSLPNCKLILEGLADVSSGAVTRPLVSVVSNVECYFSGHETPLTGGREFLESLVTAVSDYAQELLSGIPHPAAHRDRQHPHRLVKIDPINHNLHRLMVQPQVRDGVAPSTAPQQFDLNTVQLFDLVEAIDQFYADTQTLPDLAPNLAPLPKRYAIAQEPLTKRAAAPALGISSLAVAALALFFVPVPEVQRPQPTSSANAETSASPGATTSPSAAATPSASPPSNETSPSVSPSAAGSDQEQVAAALLDRSPEITDPAEQERLKTLLYDKIDGSWTTEPTFQNALEYRVGVAADGAIVGYKFINSEALEYRQEIPLLELLQVPASASGAETPENPSASEARSAEAIAQFLVVFKPDGILEVSPWYGQPLEDSSQSPAASP